jgi:hypothetical protein
VAGPGELNEFRIEPRHIGVAAGDLVIDLVDAARGLTLLPTRAIVHAVGANKDGGGGTSLHVTTPESSGLWRIQVQVGHLAGPGVYVVDDAVQFEIRVQ